MRKKLYLVGAIASIVGLMQAIYSVLYDADTQSNVIHSLNFENTGNEKNPDQKTIFANIRNNYSLTRVSYKQSLSVLIFCSTVIGRLL